MDKKVIEKSIKQSWEIEGLVISPEASAISGDFLDGRISSEKAIELIKEKHINEGKIKC